MADKSTLNLIGYILGGVTALVMMMGAVVVNDYLSGRFSLESNISVVTPANAASAQ